MPSWSLALAWGTCGGSEPTGAVLGSQREPGLPLGAPVGAPLAKDRHTESQGCLWGLLWPRTGTDRKSWFGGLETRVPQAAFGISQRSSSAFWRLGAQTTACVWGGSASRVWDSPGETEVPHFWGREGKPECRVWVLRAGSFGQGQSVSRSSERCPRHGPKPGSPGPAESSAAAAERRCGAGGRAPGPRRGQRGLPGGFRVRSGARPGRARDPGGCPEPRRVPVPAPAPVPERLMTVPVPAPTATPPRSCGPEPRAPPGGGEAAPPGTPRDRGGTRPRGPGAGPDPGQGRGAGPGATVPPPTRAGRSRGRFQGRARELRGGAEGGLRGGAGPGSGARRPSAAARGGAEVI